MATIDLHVHTNASEDGELPPREVMTLASDRGLRAIAFADHDTTAAVDEGVRLAADFGIDFLPAIEVTATFDGKDVHILGYLLDWKDARLLEACEATRAGRVEQARERVAKLRGLGFRIDFERVMEVADGRPPTSAILMAALKENFRRKKDPKLVPYVEGEKSDSAALKFFLDYHTPGKPAYVAMDMLDAREAVEIILGAGGVPVIAHPGRLPMDLVEAFLATGVEGIEVYSSNHTPQQEEHYRIFALEHNLVITAGSDFHGPGRKTAPLGGLRKGDLGMLEALRDRRERLFG